MAAIAHTAKLGSMSKKHEIWTSAQRMIDRYGEDALSQINKRITELEDSQEPQALDLWIRIRDAAQELIANNGPGSRH